MRIDSSEAENAENSHDDDDDDDDDADNDDNTRTVDDVLVKAQNEGTTTVKDLQEILPKMPSSASVAAKHLDEKEATQYIVSDANEFYISVFLEGTGLNTIIEGWAFMVQMYGYSCSTLSH